MGYAKALGHLGTASARSAGTGCLVIVVAVDACVHSGFGWCQAPAAPDRITSTPQLQSPQSDLLPPSLSLQKKKLELAELHEDLTSAQEQRDVRAFAYERLRALHSCMLWLTDGAKAGRLP